MIKNRARVPQHRRTRLLLPDDAWQRFKGQANEYWKLARPPTPLLGWTGYFRMQSPTTPVAVPHLAPAVPCRVAEPSLQIAETSSSPSLHEIASPDAST